MSAEERKGLTPLMQQYFDIKRQHPEALLLFQVGDFYELFFEDAQRAAEYLGIALTKRGTNNGEPIPLCGVPMHAIDHYLTKLVRGGFTVAVCDQLEEARPGTIVQRGVTQVLTPGTLTDSKLLDEKSASYVAVFFPLQHQWGLLFGELLTGQLFGTTLSSVSDKVLESELARFFPDEIVMPSTKVGASYQSYFKRLGYATSLEHADVDDAYVSSATDTWLQKQFGADVVQKITEQEALQSALRTFYSYLSRNQKAALDQFKQIQIYQPEDFLMLDAATQRNLELVENCQDGSRKNTLFELADGAVSPMGSRMIKKWFLRPLVRREAIEQRLDVIQALVSDVDCAQQLGALLKNVGDVERVIGRIALRRAPVNDYLMLAQALAVVPTLISLVALKNHLPLMKIISEHLGNFTFLQQLLSRAINDDPHKEQIIKDSFDHELDRLRSLVNHASENIVALELREQQETGIGSLKIRYTGTFGYYIEITKANFHLIPERYQRQQTLVGKERFTTRELRDMQVAITSAQAQIEAAEKAVFDRVKEEVFAHLAQLRRLAHALAHLDALYGFGKIAYDYGYVRPTFNTQRNITIVQGRHPVVERMGRATFIPNDTSLTDEESVWIITGPNMGGKSTYLRQVAQICLLAQVGSFVPAQAACVPLLDRIFTRIGAGDNLAGGKSTFLVEMEETALICTQATENSLVILDEVGRGTSTFDGLAIAQAVVEYIYTTVKARCLFATHYHELTLLKDQYAGIQSYYAASKKTSAGILFLYRMIKGVADGSFGLEVARIADLPKPLIARAQDILQVLTQHEVAVQRAVAPSKTGNKAALQMVAARKDEADDHEEALCLRQKVAELEAQCAQYQHQLGSLKNLDYNNMTPKQALDLLWALKERSLS